MTFGHQFAGALLQLGILLLIARELGPEGAGGYAVALLVPQLLVQLLNIGLAPANVYFLASHRFDLNQIWPSLRDASIGLILMGLGIGLALVTFAGEAAFPDIDPPLLMLALAVFPFSFAVTMVQSLFQAMQDFRTYNLLVLAQPITALVMLGALWFTGNLALGPAILVTALAHGFALVLALFALGQRTSIWGAADDRGAYLRPAIRYGIRAHLSNITAFFNYRLDLFLVNFFLGPAAAGLYSVAVRLVEQLWMLSQAVSTVLLPRLASLRGDQQSHSALTPMIARLVLWLTLLSAVVLAALIQPLISLLFGTAFAGAIIAVFLLLPGVVLKSCARIMANDLAARAMVGINMVLGAFMLVVNLVGNVLMIPVYGIAGAAIATTFAAAVNMALRLIIQQKVSGTVWWHFLLPLPEDFRLLHRSFRKKGTS